MNFRKLSLLLILFLFTVVTSYAQDYKQAAGVRIGPSTPAIKTGLTYRYFLNDKSAIEGILSVTDGLGICGLYEIHNPLSVEHLSWFYGAGGYVAGSNKKSYIGGAGIVGLDYSFADLPLNISLDWKPELNIVPSLYFEGSTVGFSVRYIF